MNKQMLGTTYGGWVVDLDSINDGDVIIDAGLGEDISFLEGLNKHKKVKIIGVDPTEKSHRFVESKNLDNLTLIKKAVEKHGVDKITMFKNSNPNHVSESVYSDHASTKGEKYDIDCISIKELREKYNPSVIKIDIEGAEYNVIPECIGVKQVCIEFHHHCISIVDMSKTKEMVKLMLDNGYEIMDNRRFIEMSFIKVD